MNYIESKYPNEDYSKYSDLPRWQKYLNYAGGDNQFALWLAFTNSRVNKLIGVGLFNLEDWLIRDSFDNGDTPQEAAVQAIQNDRLYCELLGYELNEGIYY